MAARVEDGLQKLVPRTVPEFARLAVAEFAAPATPPRACCSPRVAGAPMWDGCPLAPRVPRARRLLNDLDSDDDAAMEQPPECTTDQSFPWPGCANPMDDAAFGHLLDGLIAGLDISCPLNSGHFGTNKWKQ
jgi:hypothetical protein